MGPLSICFDLRGDGKKTKNAMTRTTINDKKKMQDLSSGRGKEIDRF
jgi:hypothetical protein